MPGTALWVDGVHLSFFVSFCLPSLVSRCLPAWMPGTALWVDGFLVCLALSPSIVSRSVVSQPGCLARLSGWTGSLFVLLCLLHLSPVLLSPSLDAWHGSLGGRVDLSPFVSFHLFPVVSQPGCLARLWVDVFICLPLSPFVSLHLFPVVSQPGCLLWVDGFICLPSSVSRCLPAWMPDTALWVGGSPFVSLHLFGCLARLSRKPQECEGKRIRVLKRTMVEKNGQGINPYTSCDMDCATIHSRVLSEDCEVLSRRVAFRALTKPCFVATKTEAETPATRT